jgi:hypothetical protein
LTRRLLSGNNEKNQQATCKKKIFARFRCRRSWLLGRRNTLSWQLVVFLGRLNTRTRARRRRRRARHAPQRTHGALRALSAPLRLPLRGRAGKRPAGELGSVGCCFVSVRGPAKFRGEKRRTRRCFARHRGWCGANAFSRWRFTATNRCARGGEHRRARRARSRPNHAPCPNPGRTTAGIRTY